MNPVMAIGFWAALFVGSHLALSSEPVRSRLVALAGERPFRGIYSIVALGTAVPLALTFAHNKHAGPMLWYLRDDASVRWLVWATMLAALILLVGGLITASPAAIGSRNSGDPTGILKITRHPSFAAFSLFGIAHILMNGWTGDVIFFGAFPVLGIAGGIHQDRRKLREIGGPYGKFVAATSFVPGAALLSGRQRWLWADMPWAAIGIGVAATIFIVVIHPMAFGGSPLG